MRLQSTSAPSSLARRRSPEVVVGTFSKALAVRFLSLFTGIGGFDLGLERAGHECAGQVEIDPFCRRVVTRRFRDCPGWADVREWPSNGHESDPLRTNESKGREDLSPIRNGAS